MVRGVVSDLALIFEDLSPLKTYRLTSDGAGDPSLVAVDAEGLTAATAAAAALAALISSIVSGLTILSALLRGLLT